MKSNFTLHAIPKEDRPRERLQQYGVQALSIQELLALILGRGIAGESVLVTAQRIMNRFQSVDGLADASFEDLCDIHGIGIAKAAQLQACFEIGKRLRGQEKFSKNSVSTPVEIYMAAKKNISNFSKEHLLLVSLSTRNQIIATDIISIGTLDASLVHPREIFSAAIRRHAASIILVHNHPSGSPEPSEEDILITKRIAKAGELFGISLLDHVIITSENFCSLKEKGCM
ncbi:DNA repair protein RadC [Candidatus Roizmanbacteria bacterium]|nr:DNA repair protein RadC [Candidatus Roizmanbacteria bacterium]